VSELESAVRLSITTVGDKIVTAVARDTLLHKASTPFDEAWVKDASGRLVAALARGNRGRKLTESVLGELRTIGEELYRALLPETTREDLAEVEGRPLLLELDEALVAVPWELLHDGKQFLCRRFAIGRAVLTPQPRRAQTARKPASPAKMLVLCSDTKGDLVRVSDEGQAIVDALDNHPGIVVRMVSDKTLDFVRAQLKEFDVVHYAGHADYQPSDPEASGWHLADGKLTARGVAELAGGRPMPYLVFANACQSSHETAWRADDPARVFGLANAFLLAGVRYYIGTQWEIVDAQSMVFARAFYVELARGKSIGVAVRRAREAVIVAEGEGGMGWASYVLYGDPAHAPLAHESKSRASNPGLPTPADIVSRESIKGVVKRINRPPTGNTGPIAAPPRTSANRGAVPAPIIEPKVIPETVRSSRRSDGIRWSLVATVAAIAAIVVAAVALIARFAA
jgi:CHAT domain-containing protein